MIYSGHTPHQPMSATHAGTVGAPLVGLRVVEVSSYVATPLCGLLLCQLGAEVIRVEPIAGAPDRHRLPRAEDGTSLYWTGLNGGKRSFAIDLESDAGQEVVADLVCGEGVEQDRGGALLVSNTERYEVLSFEALRERRPDIVHAVLSGTREGGRAVDYTVQASSGFPTITGPNGSSAPVNSVVPAWDVVAGLYLAFGMLAAVHERERTGFGQQIRVALEDVAFATAGELGILAQAQLGDWDRQGSGNDVYGTFGRDFMTSDGIRFMLVILTDRHWVGILDVTGLAPGMDALAASLRVSFRDEAERFRHRRVIGALLEAWIEARSWAEVEVALQRARVLHAKYRTFDDLVSNGSEALADMPLFQKLVQPGAGEWLAPGSPLVMGERQFGPSPAPTVGSDTRAILEEFGLDVQKVAGS